MDPSLTCFVCISGFGGLEGVTSALNHNIIIDVLGCKINIIQISKRCTSNWIIYKTYNNFIHYLNVQLLSI